MLQTKSFTFIDPLGDDISNVINDWITTDNIKGIVDTTQSESYQGGRKYVTVLVQYDGVNDLTETYSTHSFTFSNPLGDEVSDIINNWITTNNIEGISSINQTESVGPAGRRLTVVVHYDGVTEEIIDSGVLTKADVEAVLTGEISTHSHAVDSGVNTHAQIDAHIAAPHAPSDAQAHIAPTKVEVEGVLTGEISTHKHDAMYYTETEVDTMLAAKADTHSHPYLADTGTAVASDKLATARTITLSGDVSGSTTFDGTADKTITVTVADDSHNHVINNVDGLQTALDGKADTHTHPYLADTGTAVASDKLATARTITLAGDVSGSTTFDGTANKTITVTITDDSHNHVISNIDGLQTALDGKADEGVVIALPIETATTKTITASEMNGTKFLGDVAATMTLPTGAQGMQCKFRVSSTNYLRVNAGTGQYFEFYDGTVSAVGGYFRSNALFNEITVEWDHVRSKWFVTPTKTTLVDE